MSHFSLRIERCQETYEAGYNASSLAIPLAYILCVAWCVMIMSCWLSQLCRGSRKVLRYGKLLQSGRDESNLPPDVNDARAHRLLRAIHSLCFIPRAVAFCIYYAVALTALGVFASAMFLAHGDLHTTLVPFHALLCISLLFVHLVRRFAESVRDLMLDARRRAALGAARTTDSVRPRASSSDQHVLVCAAGCVFYLNLTLSALLAAGVLTPPPLGDSGGEEAAPLALAPAAVSAAAQALAAVALFAWASLRQCETHAILSRALAGKVAAAEAAAESADARAVAAARAIVADTTAAARPRLEGSSHPAASPLSVGTAAGAAALGVASAGGWSLRTRVRGSGAASDPGSGPGSVSGSGVGSGGSGGGGGLTTARLSELRGLGNPGSGGPGAAPSAAPDSAPGGGYVIPRGSWFAFSSAPHYLAEMLIYAALALLMPRAHAPGPCVVAILPPAAYGALEGATGLLTAGGVGAYYAVVAGWKVLASAPMVMCLFWVVSNLGILAYETHAWYLHTFGSAYPSERAALVPMTLFFKAK